MEPEKNNDKFKLHFFYFLIVSCLVLLILFIFVLGTYWNYWSKIWRIEEFYGQKNQTQVLPTVSHFDPALGPLSAKVTIIEYSDFLCPACKILNTNLNEIENTYGNSVRIVYKALPVINELQSKKAAVAAYCANEQNKFWQYKDLLFDNNTALTDDSYTAFASTLALNLSLFQSCVNSQKYDTLMLRYRPPLRVKGRLKDLEFAPGLSD